MNAQKFNDYVTQTTNSNKLDKGTEYFGLHTSKGT